MKAKLVNTFWERKISRIKQNQLKIRPDKIDAKYDLFDAEFNAQFKIEDDIIASKFNIINCD